MFRLTFFAKCYGPRSFDKAQSFDRDIRRDQAAKLDGHALSNVRRSVEATRMAGLNEGSLANCPKMPRTIMLRAKCS
jgi:hypothetical protein